METSAPIRITIGHGISENRAELVAAVNSLGYEVAAEVDSRRKLRERLRAERPDLVLTALEYDDGDVIGVLLEQSHTDPFPAIITTDTDSLRNVERALQDHVMAYLVEPVDKEQIKPTIYLVLKRFEEFQALRAEVEDLQQALADRKLIEQAKGMLMAREQLPEADAFRRMQKAASHRRVKLVELARAVLAAHDLALNGD